MKRFDVRIFGGLLSALLMCNASTAGALTLTPDQTIASTTAVSTTEMPLRLVERGLNHRLWEKVTRQVLRDGRVLTNRHLVKELGTGMHYLDRNGQLAESRDLVELADGRAIAQHGQLKASFAANINTVGAIQMVLPSGQLMRSHVLGLAYADPSTDQSIVIASVKDSVGEIANDNQVIYRDAFTGVKADIRYTYSKSRFEQDIILRESPPSPEALGLNPNTTWLQVFTEFVAAPVPDAKEQEIALARSENGTVTSRLLDQRLDFGGVLMAGGQAFALDDNLPRTRRSSIPTGKAWQTDRWENLLD
jgi:hypothetical protein